ncbi:hypothetical protein GCM10009665_25910 [Kitasatospora nipponensis]|uniref:Uncharacterized protein n=1 Tax=Kitasatospora nipponensis TaxID=258049 RepID=A0ABN1W421_9ACTN
MRGVHVRSIDPRDTRARVHLGAPGPSNADRTRPGWAPGRIRSVQAGSPGPGSRNSRIANTASTTTTIQITTAAVG